MCVCVCEREREREREREPQPALASFFPPATWQQGLMRFVSEPKLPILLKDIQIIFYTCHFKICTKYSTVDSHITVVNVTTEKDFV